MTMSALAARKSMTFPFPSSPHWPPTRMMTTALLGSWFWPPSLQVVEAGVVAAELELDHAGGSVAVLGDDELGNAGPLIGFVVLGPEKKHNDVRVLLDRARLAKVAEDGALLWRTAQLRDRDHRNTQLASQSLKGAGDGRDFLDAVVVASRAPMHKLQIVDEDHVDVVAHLRLPGLELKAELVHHRRVVDENLCFTQRS